MDTLKLYGPPGCGKTTSGIEWLAGHVKGGHDLRDCAFVSFTRAACDEARDRICEQFDRMPDDDDMPFYRTIHALAKRTLGIGGLGWLADSRLGEFGEECGYDIKPPKRRGGDDDVDMDAIGGEEGEDAPYLRIWGFARNRLVTDPGAGWDTFADYDMDGLRALSYPRFMEFVTDYEEWKGRNWVRDFTDLLLEAVEAGRPLPVEVGILDEAQDMSPLLWAAADALFANTPLRATLGDDDQAIYSFQGADPHLLNGRPAESVVKLEQSYRLPAAVVRCALRIIRQNGNRIDKTLLARPGSVGEVERSGSLNGLALNNGETWFVMLRNWKLFDYVAEDLERMGVPYRVSAGKRHSPWAEHGPLRAMQCVLQLSEGKELTLHDLIPLVERTRSQTKTRPGVWVHGAKSRLKSRVEVDPTSRVTWETLPSLGMTAWGFDHLMLRDFSLLSLEVRARDVSAYEAAQQAGTLDRPALVTVGSVHSFKGREADNAAVIMGCTGGPLRAMQDPERWEEENRIAYVAATRVRKRLFGVTTYAGLGIYPWELLGV